MRRYYDHLTKRGVHRYAWEELRGDYALGAAQALYVAAGWCGIEGDPQPMRWVWGGGAMRAACWPPPQSAPTLHTPAIESPESWCAHHCAHHS